MIKYIIKFRTMSEALCEVHLEDANYTGSPIELVGGATPFTILTETSDLLSPIRSSNATLSVYGSDYLQDLYTSDPQGIKVTLKINNEVKWLGYLMPDTFSQDYSHQNFTYEMECVNALSVLKNKYFDLSGGFVSFLEIIKRASDLAGFKDLYLTNAVRTAGGNFYDLKIATANFYDELGRAMTYYEVLEEIAKYAGCTFTSQGANLYMLDYKAISLGFNSYSKHTGATVTNVTLADNRAVGNYKGTGANISRIAGKNKATVNCSLYEIKDLLPTFDDEGSEVWKPQPVREFTETVKVGKEKQHWKGIVRYYKQPKYKFYHYATPTSTPEETDSPPTGTKLGSCFVRTTEFEESNTPNVLRMTDEVLIKMWNTNSAQHLKGVKVISLKTDKQMLFHKDVWFCVNLQFKLSKDIWNKDLGGDDFTASKDFILYQEASLRVGEYYFNGTAWVKTASRFRMPVTYKKGDHVYNAYKSVDNKNTYDKGLGDITGFIFKAPDFAIIGDCELTLHAPDSVEYSGLIQGAPPMIPGMQYMYYKDIAFSYGVPDLNSIYGDYTSRDSKTDVVYENEIGDYIEEADDIDLKICTNTDKKLALSSVIKNGLFLDTLTTDAFGTDIAENIILKRVIGLYKKPRSVVDPTLASGAKPYSVFSEPHLNKRFINAGGDEDVRMERTRYNLIEIA